jgi:hypothetical protein
MGRIECANREWWEGRTSEKRWLGAEGRKKREERLSECVSVYSTPPHLS